MPKPPAFGCTACGATFARWAGRCTACGAMNSVAELTKQEARLASGKGDARPRTAALRREPLAADAAPAPAARISTGLGELDRVLGGGLVPGGVALLTGEPGIGKSTLLAQASLGAAAHGTVLYATAEESLDQVRARFVRLGAARDARVELAASNDAAELAAALAGVTLAIIDSVQLLALDDVEGEPGGVTQVKACAHALVQAAKAAGTALVLVGHVTKDGGVAGPRLLEHLVDTVLAFEGDRYGDLRILRALKNRFGATQELGLFRMGGRGLEEVPDAGGLFLADRDPGVPGTCVCPVIDAGRCLLVEVQALVNPTTWPQPQRRVAGLDPNRVAMVIAVLTRRLGLPLGQADIFVNVTGGVRVQEPAADLALALAIASSLRGVAVPADLVAFGEVGLGGELRPAARFDMRAGEARRLGFQKLLAPGGGQGRGRLVATRIDAAVEMGLG